MTRRFSTIFKNAPASSSSSPPAEEKCADVDDGQSTTTLIRDEPLPGPTLKAKHVDYYYSRWTKSWKYRNMNSKVTVETLPSIESTSNDEWKDFSFVIIRTLNKNAAATFKIYINSGYILKACKDVIQSWPGISWSTEPLCIDPEIFITFYPSFVEYASNLSAQKQLTDQETHVLSSVNLLTSTLASDYKVTLAKIERLTSHGEITFALLFALLVPRQLMVAKCAITGLPRLFELVSWTRASAEGKPAYQLELESVDLIDSSLGRGSIVGRIQTTMSIKEVSGIVKIDSLDVYPFKFHPDPEGVRGAVTKRGKKWVGLIGIHHMEFEGIAALKYSDKPLKHQVRSRIIVDRNTFRRLHPEHQLPTIAPPKVKDTGVIDTAAVFNPPTHDLYGNPLPETWPTNDNLVQAQSGNDTPDIELTEDDLLLAPTVVFGFSLADKVWLEFNVEKISPVEWNSDAFSNLVLPQDRKNLLRSLVEAHHKELGFDDFIKGKGQGLVVSLFGPPGVGKTFSAEATSEHVKRPLLVVGGGDLGTSAAGLDSALERIFDVATAWKAIVLIDEADVFLEQRSLHDLERNAMVAVFLRHVEYYRGILFLTTNRVKTFDEAFLSRIHVALHFRSLSQSSKEKVWAAFIKKMGDAVDNLGEKEIRELASRDINGRQIKNAARTAHSMAVARGQKVGIEHLRATLDAMEEFAREFEQGRLSSA